MKRFFILVLTALPVLGYAISGDEAVSRFKQRMYGANTMEGNISITNSTGMSSTGQFKFMAPGRFYIKFSNPSGKVICSNGKKLWVYDPSTGICGIQELDPRGLSGGIAGMLNGYMAIASQSGSDYTIKLKGSGRGYSEIYILADKTFLLKRATFKNESGEGFTVSLNNVRVGVSMHAGLFDYNVPSSAQMIKDPLNIK
jgi:outer membrane lipoprotein-sorting protein